MSGAPDTIRAFLAPLVPDFAFQFGRWTDDVQNKARKFAVLKPAGGGRAELVRRPQYTLTLIGPRDDALGLHDAADTLIQAMRESAGGLVFLQPGEPVYMPTDDGRHVLEIALSAITS
jgi:hypothetical protein